MKTVRVAVVGAGSMANRVHYPSLATLPGVEVVAVDRAGGRLVVRGEALDEASIRDAVAAAGYRVVTAPGDE